MVTLERRRWPIKEPGLMLKIFVCIPSTKVSPTPAGTIKPLLFWTYPKIMEEYSIDFLTYL